MKKTYTSPCAKPLIVQSEDLLMDSNELEWMPLMMYGNENENEKRGLLE